ncbi:MAG: hypothetical protein N2489_04615 [Clostridia bacterium]|nr:hypothetical protein [Clostridia bacterium]
MYRRFPYKYRRPVPWLVNPAPRPGLQTEAAQTAQKGTEQIPLPNEAETPHESNEKATRSKPWTLQRIFQSLHIDDLILICLIILLLQEGINDLEDDFLLIILIYLFICGVGK